jgi:hypothetical protein
LIREFLALPKLAEIVVRLTFEMLRKRSLTKKFLSNYQSPEQLKAVEPLGKSTPFGPFLNPSQTVT